MEETKQRILDRLTELKDSGDWEAAHSEADKLLCEFLEHLGHKDVADAWDLVPGWYA